MLQRLAKFSAYLFIFIVLLAMTAWGALAIYYSDQESGVTMTFAIAFGLFALAVYLMMVIRGQVFKPLLFYLAAFIVLLAWWHQIEPSNDRDWQTDVARLANAEIDGNLVRVTNIRNFDYRTETDFIPAYYDKTFDLEKLTSVDLVAVYWMGPAIAHTFVSFGFEDGEQLAISIETRKEKSEGYSTIKGFFKQYELYYVVADERDVIRVRTNYRENPPEDVYVYRAKAPIENGRRLFMEYMHRIQKLNTEPEFYNTLMDNCTTGIWINTRINPDHIPLSWKVLASGYVPSYLYDTGKLDQSLPFEELQRLSLVNSKAQAADKAADFSRIIREGLPGMQAEQ